MENYELSSIWKNGFSIQENPNDEIISQDLKKHFKRLRANIIPILNQIYEDFSDLTIHDINHVDALWCTASMIAGDNYKLNPLETFIFGCSLLIHDAALCYEAFENGVDGLRNTDRWKDLYTQISESGWYENEKEAIHEADFKTIRYLHADQAPELLKKDWIFSNTEQSEFQLDLRTIMNHYAEIIGKIATSHHWNIEDISKKLIDIILAIPSININWDVSPQKIACLLRCADAAQIDNRRAPDSLLAICKKNTVSYDHWKAQNRIGVIGIDKEDKTGSTAFFTSSSSFSEEETLAWWVAYDAINLIDKEIKSCNEFLEINGYDSFKIKRIKGANNPIELSKSILTNGWTPHLADVHITDPKHLASLLGGEALYGTNTSYIDKLRIVLRELIQNARDAIKAEKFFRMDDAYLQELIRIRCIKEQNKIIFTITDEGIGMSRRILLGPFLDFGTSFWTSSLIIEEFEGLRSSDFKSIGKYGIGFYSVFMIAKNIVVTTKTPLQKKKSSSSGQENVVNRLIFKNGVFSKPLLIQNINDFNPKISTEILFELTNNDVIDSDFNCEISIDGWDQKRKIGLSDLIASICIGLDVTVELKTNNNDSKIVHNNILREFNKGSWLDQFSYNSLNNIQGISKIKERLEPIDRNKRHLGIAAISTTHEQHLASATTVGGLSNGTMLRNAQSYFGFLECHPDSAKRDSGKYLASTKELNKWANEQFVMLKNDKSLTGYEKYCASINLCQFKIDTIDFAYLPVNINGIIKFLNFKELSELYITMDIAMLKSNREEKLAGNFDEKPFPGYALIDIYNPIGDFFSLKLRDNVPVDELSLIGCFCRVLKKQNKHYNIKCISTEKMCLNEQINALIFSKS